MKKYIYLAGLCSLLSLGSCDDFLTVESPDELNSENFWRDKSDVEAGMASVYSQMYLMTYQSDRWTFPEVKWPVEAYREDINQMGYDAMNYPNWTELYYFTYTNGNSQFTSMWESYYRGISYANQVITKTSEMDESLIDPNDKTQLVAEARFMRAFYHMQLLLNWEQIIIRDEYITDSEQLSKEIATREEAWNFIIEDLQAAASALPASYSSDNIGRATRGAAYAYLGWAYLTRAYEEPSNESSYLSNALSALNSVTGYELVDNFLSMFNGTNKNSAESIFEIQFSMTSDGGASYRTQCHQWMAAQELGGWDEIAPTQVLMDEFMKEGPIATTGFYDSRLYESVFYQCDYFNDGTGKVYGYNYDELFCNSNGVAYNRPVYRKFLPATVTELTQNYTAINVPLMRYANVLLMKAEVLNKQGHPEQAIPLINQVREVHGDMPAMKGTSQAEVQNQIEHERMIEFALENLRWYDLRRWGKLSQALNAAGRTGFSEANNAFYPIPQTELNANDAM